MSHQNTETPMQKLLGDTAPALVAFNDDILFGQVWEDPTLSKRDRSLLVISSLVSAGNLEQLHFHIPFGIQNGLTRDEIVAALTQLAFYGGWPKAVSALQIAQKIFAEIATQ